MSVGGRKYKRDEVKITRLGELCVEWAIGRMQSDKTSESIKKDIALKVLSRWIPQSTDFTSDGQSIVAAFNYVRPDNTNNQTNTEAGQSVAEAGGQ